LGVDGLLNISKPAGLTSFATVARVRKLAGEKKAGHAGTLDPLATGVLPIGLGAGTRVLSYLLELSKLYRAEIELGATTDTYDAQGRTISRGDPSLITLEEVQEALKGFVGEVWQRPPVYSALKLGGQPFYSLARRGHPQRPPPRRVRVYAIHLVAFQPPRVVLEVEVGRGFYLRSLAHDMGEVLGCGGFLKDLVRLRYGPFLLEEASPPEGDILSHLLPLDFSLQGFPPLELGEEEALALMRGQPLPLTGTLPPGECFRAYREGAFLSVLRRKGDALLPEKVFLSNQ